MEKTQHPFLKLTLDEKFPRLLITRRPENKTSAQNIYGAFLPVGMTRRMLDLLARTFRLRPCELDIQGDFDAPCPEYFLHRCLAPCVAKICSREIYLESVEIVHLILSNQTEIALKKIDEKIISLSDALEFEIAAEWHNKRQVIEEIAKNAKWQIDVSAMNDVLSIDVNSDTVQIYLTTLRRGKSVGKLHFQIENNRAETEIIKDFIEDFYQFYAPKQIFVPHDFPGRKLLEENLRLRFGRKTKIIADASDKIPVSVSKTKSLAEYSFKHKKNQTLKKSANLLDELKNIFELRKLPRRIECFDVAHLSGKAIVAARAVAIDGVWQSNDGLVWEFENVSETEALAAAVRERLRLLPNKKDLPDLLIVDGAKQQINAVMKSLIEFESKKLPLIGAVKPPKAHNQISHFLTADGKRLDFDRRSKAMNFLLNLRDAAHRLANETHRELHSLTQIFKNNENAPQIRYLLVPKRYAERDGDADDLSPIRSLNQANEIILKTKRKKNAV